jgi:hypothetical protein
MTRLLTLFVSLCAWAVHAAEPVTFQARTEQSGPWSDARTWEGARPPQAGDIVQVRAGHTVTYDVDSGVQLRMLHVAGTLTFSREVSTTLDVGLIKVEPGATTTEDGFNCHDDAPTLPAATSVPALGIGTPASPIPEGVRATIRLRQYKGTNAESLPAIIVCGGRWDVHGAPLKRTWLKLAAAAKAGDSQLTVEEPVNDWHVGDRVIITSGDAPPIESGATFQKRPFGKQKPVGTEERVLTAVAGAVITLDRPLGKAHRAEGMTRCEVANLSRNVVIESAEPAGARGHTMYHRDSSGGISYAEFRHLGKEGVLGKYTIHFHQVRDTMRGSGVLGASIWDSHNRWVTVHGTDHLLIRDCVGYQSRGHGFFLEDATEQWNVFDRNLAVQAFGSVPLPKQVLAYDPNDGAGFWWANGQNTFTRNVACENDRYGFHFQIAKTPDFNPLLRLRSPDGSAAERDVRTVPFMRFEENESHSEGLFDFRFGDEEHGTVHGDRAHPFIVRNLRAWASRYVIRPNIQYFLLDGLRVQDAAYGIYHPDYDMHVYRDISFQNVTAEPINGGHDEESLPHGDFTYDGLTFANCRLRRDPLVQLTAIAPKLGLVGHFRGVRFEQSACSESSLIDFGGGPRTRKTEHPVTYYLHGLPEPVAVTRLASLRVAEAEKNGSYTSIEGLTGPEMRAAPVQGVAFPELLAPIDDLPPATLITRMEDRASKRIVSGVSHDNGEVATVTVNGLPATISSQLAGVADWSIELPASADENYRASAMDVAGNAERMPHQRQRGR